MNEIVNNKVNLCDSCSQVYPDCTSRPENVYFGDGIGHDNICACSEYRPKTCGDGDTISRAAAINALGDMVMNWTDSDYELGQLNQWKADRKAIIDLPSAQPKSSESKRDLSDTISRQAAIDAIGEKPLVWDDLSDFDLGKAAQWSDDVDAIKALPSAQPEIVKCRECKHMQKDEIFHQCWCNGREVKYDDFCSHAERRQDD